MPDLKQTKLTTNFKELPPMQQENKDNKYSVAFKASISKTGLVSYLKNNLGFTIYISTICLISFTSPAQADWFQVGNIRANLITPMYTLINENLGFIAFAVGGAATFLARGQDMYQKAIAFGVGSLGTAGAVKLAQTVLHLG